MYIPSYYKEEDINALYEFMCAHNFAILISSANDTIRATHLPFVIEKKEDKIILISHMAKANPQWKEFLNKELLIIFQGPHAYISPSHYEKKQNVPTWNYIAVHAYGKCKLIEKKEDVIKLMEHTIHKFENKFMEQWETLPKEYIDGMLKAIVCFEIEITKLEGKFKLSQNKTKIEQQNIISNFEKSNNSIEQELAKEMKKKL
jgi:transcriptional regulator